MISPQESGQAPNDAADYSWSPFGPYAYWRKRIGADIAKQIEALADAHLFHDGDCHYALIDAINIANGIKNGETP